MRLDEVSHGDDAEPHRLLVREALEGRRRAFRMTTRFLRADIDKWRKVVQETGVRIEQ